jgi:microcompartment protein CcmK/EutM
MGTTAGTFRVDLTYATGVLDGHSSARYARAVDELVRMLPTGSRIESVADETAEAGVVEVVVRVPGHSAAQALHEVGRAIDLAAVAAAGADNLGECRRAVIERV